MKILYPLAVVMMLAAVGCQGNKPETQPAASIQQLAPSPDMNSAYSNAYAPQAAAPAYQPVASYTPAPLAAVDTATPAAMSDMPSTPSASGTRYTIKHGDTLFRIAADHYGSGGKWKQIADANPGINPNKLKVGQAITLP